MNNFMKYWGKKDIVEQLVWVTAILLLIVVGSFSAYYYWDRYVYLGDESPADLAIGDLEEMVRENPEEPGARLALADEYFRSGRFALCIEQAETVIDVYGDDYDIAYYLIGMSYAMMEDTEQAIPSLESFVTLRNQAPMASIDDTLESALYFLGRAYMSHEDYEAAIPIFSQALSIDFTDADSMYLLGQAYAATDQHELALEQYHEAVRFVPNFTEVYNAMIVEYTALNLPDKVAYARGMELYIQDDYQNAIAHLFSSYETDPEFVPNLLGLGLVYEEVGDYDFALLYLNEVLTRDPDNFMANNVVGRIQQLLQSEDN